MVRNVFGKALGLKRELQCLQRGKLQPRTDLAGGGGVSGETSHSKYLCQA